MNDDIRIYVADRLTTPLSVNGHVTPGAYWCARCSQPAYGTFGTVGWCDEHGEVDRCGGVPAGTFHCSDDTPVPKGDTRWGEPPGLSAAPTEMEGG